MSPNTNRVTIADLGFDTRSNDAANASRLVRSLIETQLRDVHDIYLSPDADYAVQALLLKFPINQREAVLVGKFLKTDWVIWGTNHYENNTLSVTAYALNAKNTQFKSVSASSGDLFGVRDQVTQSLLKEMRVPLTESEKRSILRRWTDSAKALRNYGLAKTAEQTGYSCTNIERYLKLAVRADPKFSEAYFELAAVLYNEHDNEEAIKAARRALELRPDYAAAHEILAILFDSEGKFLESENEFTMATRLDPDNAETFERIGELYSEHNLDASALTNFDRALALDPFLAIARAHLGYIYANTGDWKMAASELNTASNDVLPNDIDTEKELCISFANIHQFGKAISHGQKFLDLARSQGGNPATIQYIQSLISQLQYQLTPFYFTNAPPRQYTQSSLNATLEKAFGSNELALVVNPLAANAAMGKWAADLTVGATNDLQKAEMLFNAIVQHPDRMQQKPYTAEETFSLWDTPDVSFHCQEYAFLFVALARCAGLQAYNVDVEETCIGEKAFHACAAVFFGNRYILVDPAYCYFGARHRKFTVLDDLQSTGIYLSELSGLERCNMGYKLAPDLRLTQSHLFDVLLDSNKVQEATEIVTQMAREDPNGWMTDIERARLAFHKRHYDEAIEFATFATKLSPRSGMPYLILGMAYGNENKFAEAKNAFQEALNCILSEHQIQLASNSISYIDETLKNSKLTSRP